MDAHGEHKHEVSDGVVPEELDDPADSPVLVESQLVLAADGKAFFVLVAFLRLDAQASEQCGPRDPESARSLNPSLQTFKEWLARNKDRIPLE